MRRNRPAATLVVLVAPFLLLFVIGGMTGSLDLGSRELTFIPIVWLVGLAFVWWPRGPRAGDSHDPGG